MDGMGRRLEARDVAGVSFQLETIATYAPDAELIWKEQYKELCRDKVRMPEGPDKEYYVACEKMGILQIVTARAAERLVGHHLTIIRPHPHYKSVLCAFEDAFWLAPEYRKGLVGVKLISESLKHAKARGAQLSFHMSNMEKPTDRVFEFLDFRHTHNVYAKWIGD